MRIIELADKQARLSEKEYKKLLERFDAQGARLTRGNIGYVIDKPCICPGYGWAACMSCSFREFGDHGCVVLLSKAGLLGEYLYLTKDKVSWLIFQDVGAREQVKAIHDALLSLRKE